MKKFARIVQCDERGQIVIPKDVRQELKIDSGSGFYVYVIENEGILLKTIPAKELKEHYNMLQDIENNAEKIKVNKKNVKKSVEKYRKASGSFENIT